MGLRRTTNTMPSQEFRRIYAKRRARDAARAAAVEAAKPCWCGMHLGPKAGHSIREYRAMKEPDATVYPDRHKLWQSYQSDAYDPDARSTTPMEPNPDAVKLHGQNVANLTPAAVRVINRYRKQVSKIKQMADLSPAIRTQLLALAKRDANSDLAPIIADLDRANQAVAELTQRRMQPKPLDAAGEQRISRAWSRIERILDKAPDGDRLGLIETHIKRAKDAGDDVTLRALWEGIPGYLEADERSDRGREEAARVRDTLVLVAAPAEAAQAYAERKEYDRGSYRVGLSVGQAKFALSDDASADTAGTTFPGWKADELHELAEETAEERQESSEASLRSMMPSAQ